MKLLSCGVVVLSTDDDLFVCHATGTPRWDLPKGLAEPGETPLDAAVREAWEESGLELDPASLLDLGELAYLPQKRLHLFSLRVLPDAIDVAACRCRSTFPHHATGRATPEADRWAWMPLARLDAWCGKNMTKVLVGLDWERIRGLPAVARVPVG